MAKKSLTNPHGLEQIYARRQPRRPHYLREWMEHRGIESQAELAEAIEADKSVISRWLDEDHPTTPGTDWQKKLAAFFGGEGDPVDIFRHPLDDWFVRFFEDKTLDQIERGKRLLEAAFPREEPKQRSSR